MSTITNVLSLPRDVSESSLSHTGVLRAYMPSLKHWDEHLRHKKEITELRIRISCLYVDRLDWHPRRQLPWGSNFQGSETAPRELHPKNTFSTNTIGLRGGREVTDWGRPRERDRDNCETTSGHSEDLRYSNEHAAAVTSRRARSSGCIRVTTTLI